MCDVIGSLSSMGKGGGGWVCSRGGGVKLLSGGCCQVFERHSSVGACHREGSGVPSNCRAGGWS